MSTAKFYHFLTYIKILVAIRDYSCNLPEWTGKDMTFYSRFVWTDLSTYHVEKAKAFYQATFGWEYEESEEETYNMAFLGNRYVAGIYLLPESLQKKNFPPFWMPYIHVASVDHTHRKALSWAKVKVEMPLTVLADGSKIALIRDPLGAGFTIYEGEIQSPSFLQGHGTPIWFELHISQIKEIQSFYENMFGWNIEMKPNGKEALISLKNGEPIASILELQEAFRMGYQYWIPTFGVKHGDKYLDALNRSQGDVVATLSDDRKIIIDSQGASFIISSFHPKQRQGIRSF